MHRKKRAWLSWLLSPVLAIAITGMAYLSTLAASPVRALPTSTVTVHRVAIPHRVHHAVRQVVHQTIRTYTIKAGDTLGTIAEQVYGGYSTWPALWWSNRKVVPDPNDLVVGEVLTLSNWHPVSSWLLTAAVEAE